MKILFTYVTCKNAAEAKKIGSSLVKKKLAACAVVIPKAESFFAWNGKFKKASESVLLIKAGLEKKSKLEKEIKRMHSYEVPCILFFKPETTADYSAWVKV